MFPLPFFCAPLSLFPVPRHIAHLGTSLKCPRQGRNFIWAVVTLEIYAIDSCSEFAEGPMLFDDVKLWDVNMSSITPKWWLTPPTKPCKGKITLNTNGSLAVEHSVHA